MAIFKKSVIKTTTRKRARRLFDAIGPPNSDMLGTLKNIIRLGEEFSFDGAKFGIPLDEFSGWQEFYYLLIWVGVYAELSYDNSIGEDEDMKLCQKIATEELLRWAESHGVVRFPEQTSAKKKIVVLCPRCSKKLRVPQTNTKIKVFCPKCNNSFIL